MNYKESMYKPLKYRIRYDLLSNRDVGNRDLVLSDRATNLKDSYFGALQYTICEVCSRTYFNGCKGHCGKASLNSVKDGVIIKPATLAIVHSILKYICGKCGSIKNNNIVNEILRTKNAEKLATLKKSLQNSKCQVCGESNKIVPSANKVDFEYAQSKTKGPRTEIPVCEIYAWLMQLDRSFIEHVLSLKCDQGNLFFKDNIPIIPGYYRESNIYGQGQISDNINIPINKICSAIAKGSATTIAKLYRELDTARGSNPYNNNNRAFVPLDKQVNGADKNGLIKTYITGKRRDQSGRMVLEPLIDGKIGEITIPAIAREKLDTHFYLNEFTKPIIMDLATKNTIGLLHKQTILVKDRNHIIPYKIINHEGVVSGTTSMDIGDYIVTEKIENYDPILFNRQPTLHKHSTMSSYFKYRDENVIRTPPATHPPQNADCDGDEENIVNLCEPMSIVEASFMMNARSNPCNTINTCCIFGLVQNMPMAVYMIYNKKNMDIKYVASLLQKKEYIEAFYTKFIKDDAVRNDPRARFEFLRTRSFSGAELLSILFDDYITYPGYFDNGILSMASFNQKSVSSQSQNSIFTVYAKYSGCKNVCDLIDYFAYISLRFLKKHGLSANISDLLPVPVFLPPIQQYKRELISTMNKKLEEYISAGMDGHIYISGENDINKKRTELIEEADENLKRFVVDHVVSNSSEDSVLMTMYNCKYKISDNILKKMYGWIGYIPNDREGTKLACRNYFYYLPNDQSVVANGFIPTSNIEGLSFKEFAHRAKNESLNQSVTTSCGTGTTGALGKRLVKSLENCVVSPNRGINIGNTCLLPVANFIGVSGADLLFLPVRWPHAQMEWYTEIVDLYNMISSGFYLDHRESFIDGLIFPVNIELEISTFQNMHPDVSEISSDEALDMIAKFMIELRDTVFFDLTDITFVFYILLTYMNPFYVKRPSVEAFEFVFDLIRNKIDFSLSPNTPIGLEYSCGIQETYSQTSLSSFHTESKGGRKINTSFIEPIKTILELGGRSVIQQVTIISPFKHIVDGIRHHINYINLGLFNPDIDIRVESDMTIISISLHMESMLKEISIQEMYKLIEIGVKNLKLVVSESFFMDIRVQDSNVVYNVYLDSEEDNEQLRYEVLMLRTFLVKKGLPLNVNVQLDYHQVAPGENFITVGQEPVSTWREEETIPSDGKPPARDCTIYSITFLINELSSLEVLDLINCKVTCNLYNIQRSYGIDFLQDTMLDKILTIIHDYNMYSAYHLLISNICKTNTPMPVKSLKKTTSIIKAAVHGEGKAIVSACANKVLDPCIDMYSCLFLGTYIPYGTNADNIFYDLEYIMQYTSSLKVETELAPSIAEEDIVEDEF